MKSAKRRVVVEISVPEVGVKSELENQCTVYCFLHRSLAFHHGFQFVDQVILHMVKTLRLLYVGLYGHESNLTLDCLNGINNSGRPYHI